MLGDADARAERNLFIVNWFKWSFGDTQYQGRQKCAAVLAESMPNHVSRTRAELGSNKVLCISEFPVCVRIENKMSRRNSSEQL